MLAFLLLFYMNWMFLENNILLIEIHYFHSSNDLLTCKAKANIYIHTAVVLYTKISVFQQVVTKLHLPASASFKAGFVDIIYSPAILLVPFVKVSFSCNPFGENANRRKPKQKKLLVKLCFFIVTVNISKILLC